MFRIARNFALTEAADSEEYFQCVKEEYSKITLGESHPELQKANTNLKMKIKG